MVSWFSVDSRHDQLGLVGGQGAEKTLKVGPESGRSLLQESRDHLTGFFLKTEYKIIISSPFLESLTLSVLGSE